MDLFVSMVIPELVVICSNYVIFIAFVVEFRTLKPCPVAVACQSFISAHSFLGGGCAATQPLPDGAWNQSLPCRAAASGWNSSAEQFFGYHDTYVANNSC